MNLEKIIQELRTEWNRVNQTIEAVERIYHAKTPTSGGATSPKRGRPPGAQKKPKPKSAP